MIGRWKTVGEEYITFRKANRILRELHEIRMHALYLPAHKQSNFGEEESYSAYNVPRLRALQSAYKACKKISGVRPRKFDRIHHVAEESLEDVEYYVSKGDLKHTITMEAGTISAAINGKVIEEKPLLSVTVIAFEYKR